MRTQLGGVKKNAEIRILFSHRILSGRMETILNRDGEWRRFCYELVQQPIRPLSIPQFREQLKAQTMNERNVFMKAVFLLPLLVATNVFASTGDIGSGGVSSSVCNDSEKSYFLLWETDRISEKYDCEGFESALCVVKATWKHNGDEYVSVFGSLGGERVNMKVRLEDDVQGSVSEEDGLLVIKQQPVPAAIIDQYKYKHLFVLDKNTGSAGYRSEKKEVMSLSSWKVRRTDKLSCKRSI
ncbi:MAG: hypothetical protein J7501_00555 [Bdellovibrio sp.]|nr:hypothetical protein [Bdellovibrio sp.]